jgi:hypothetical protein
LLTGFALERRALVDLLRGRRVAGLGGIAAIGGALLAALLLLPAFRHYLAAAGTVQRYPAAKLAELLPPPLALLNSGEGSWLGRPFSLWTGIPAQPFAGEFELGAGFVATGLALVGLAAARRPWLAWILAGSAVAWILLVRWPGGFSVWGAAMERFPALGLLRAVSRLHLLLLPGIAAATLLGLRAARRRWGPVAAAVLCAVVVAEQVRVWEPREIPASITPAAVAAALPDDCAAFFLSSFGERKFNTPLQLAAMWTALETGVPTVNGYSGYFPRGWKLYPSHEPQAGEGDLRVRLDRWLARHEFSGELCWLRYSPAEPERALIVEKFRRP